MSEGNVWTHRDCGGRVFWDMSGGFCANCEEEGLDVEDVEEIPLEDAHLEPTGEL